MGNVAETTQSFLLHTGEEKKIVFEPWSVPELASLHSVVPPGAKDHRHSCIPSSLIHNNTKGCWLLLFLFQILTHFDLRTILQMYSKSWHFSRNNTFVSISVFLTNFMSRSIQNYMYCNWAADSPIWKYVVPGKKRWKTFERMYIFQD